jgi:uncharacterized protein YggE
MKKRLLLVLGLVPVTLAVLAAGCGTLTPPPAVSQAAGGSAGQNTGIWVTGEGKATAVPDVAILTLGVQAQESTVAQAQSETSSAMNAIVGELKSAGVADKDIQTQQYYITPVWTTNKDTGQQTLAGYRVTNTVTAKIRTVAKTGDIINAVVSAGGNYTTINSISFTVDNPSPYQKTARQAAMADAQARAKTLADAAGVKLGAPTYISESGNFLPIVNVPVPSAGAPAPSPPPISPGEATITVDVQVVYSIK